jgi:hypothetical protein
VQSRTVAHIKAVQIQNKPSRTRSKQSIKFPDVLVTNFVMQLVARLSLLAMVASLSATARCSHDPLAAAPSCDDSSRCYVDGGSWKDQSVRAVALATVFCESYVNTAGMDEAISAGSIKHCYHGYDVTSPHREERYFMQFSASSKDGHKGKLWNQDECKARLYDLIKLCVRGGYSVSMGSPQGWEYRSVFSDLFSKPL